jgi:chemotaxis protein CheZ
MVATHLTLADLYGPTLERLNQAARDNNSEEFHLTLESIKDARADDVTRELRVLAETLHDAMLKFRSEFRIADLAEREVPDARARLHHVMKLTDEAAHKTMDLIERSGPLADRTVKGAANLAGLLKDARGNAREIHGDALLDRVSDFLTSATNDFGQVRANLAEVMIAQTYQDLTGQIIRGVVTLVEEVERVMEELLRMTGATGRSTSTRAPDPAQSSRGFGPAVPGTSSQAVDGQQDIDDLMAGLGI